MLTRVLLKSVAASVAAVGAVGLAGPSARADFVIDTFATPTPGYSYSLGSAVGSVQLTGVPTPDVLTGSSGTPGRVTRTELIGNADRLSSPASVELGTPSGGAPRFSLGTGPNATAVTSLRYNYGSGQNLATAGNAFQLTFGFADLATPFTVRLGDGTGTSTQAGVATATGAGVYSIPIGSFTGVDLTNVRSVEVILNRNLTLPTQPSTTSADVILTDVRVTTPGISPPPVPAPPAAVLALAAVPALGLWRRARRKA